MLQILSTIRSTRRSFARARMVLPLLALAGAAACGSSGSPTAPKSGVIGDYALTQIANTPLPAVIHQGPWLEHNPIHFYDLYIVRVTGGGIDLDPDGTFSMWFDADIDADGTPKTGSVVLNGTYEVQGSTVTVLPDGSDTPNVFTVQNGTIVLTMDLMGKGTSLDYAFQR